MRLVILAGGSGTRLFPISTEDQPKQFVKIFDGESLFQKTLKRFGNYFSKIQVITLEKYKNIVEEQARETGYTVEIITEPSRRNTLAAITLAALLDSTPMFITPADHIMKTNKEIIKRIKHGLEHSKNRIILFGITPRHPATEYGYIQPGKNITEIMYEVKKFHEKPNITTAKHYLHNGCLWNSGMFAVNPAHFISEVERLAPIYTEKIQKYIEDGDVYQYGSLPDLSIDKGILERTNTLGVIPLSTYWSDLGSYKSIYEYFEKDNNGNVIIGNAHVLDTRDSLIISDSEVNVYGMNRTVIVAWKGQTYVGPLDDMKAPKHFVYIP